MAGRWVGLEGSACRPWFRSPLGSTGFSLCSIGTHRLKPVLPKRKQVNRVLVVVTLISSLGAQNGSLRGTVTDPSGAAVPGAVVQLRGPGGGDHAKTGTAGQDWLPWVAAGEYPVPVGCEGCGA